MRKTETFEESRRTFSCSGFRGFKNTLSIKNLAVRRMVTAVVINELNTPIRESELEKAVARYQAGTQHNEEEFKRLLKLKKPA